MNPTLDFTVLNFKLAATTGDYIYKYVGSNYMQIIVHTKEKFIVVQRYNINSKLTETLYKGWTEDQQLFETIFSTLV